MKALLSLLVFLFLANLTSAQQNQIPFDAASWTTHIITHTDEGVENHCIDYKWEKDTIINNQGYHFINSDWGYWKGFFRQAGPLVYFIPPEDVYTWNTGNTEFQVFDFSLESGDTTTLHSFSSDWMGSVQVVVSMTDSIESLDGVRRKRITINGLGNTGLSYADCGSVRWVEGVGSSTGQPFYWWTECYPGIAQMNFDCFNVNGIPVVGPCDCQATTSTSAPELSQIRVYPNPVSSFLNIDLESPFIISLYNSAGILIAKGLAENRIDLSTLNNGIYFLEIEAGNNKVVRKIVKQ